MEKTLSKDSVIDILWPRIKEFAARENSGLFSRLGQVLEKNGQAYDLESQFELERIFEKVSDAFRVAIISPEGVNDHLAESVEFASLALCDLAKALQMDEKFNTHFHEQFEGYIDNWFSNAGEKGDSVLRFSGASDYLAFLKSARPLRRLNGMTASQILDELSASNGGFGSGWDPVTSYVVDATYQFSTGLEDGLSQSQIAALAGLIPNIEYLAKLEKSVLAVREQTEELRIAAMLETFHEDEGFIEKAQKLLASLSSSDRYHGTTCSQLEPIRQQGLYMVREDLDTTSYPLSRFGAFGSPNFLDQLLVYRTGMEGTRGEGMVFFKGDADVTRLSAKEKASAKLDYSMTGPLGPKFKVAAKDIIGTIDTAKREVVFGPAFNRQNEAGEPNS